MDPASCSIIDDGISHPPRGAEFVEWYEFLGVMILWDLARSVFTAWLTKYWIDKKPSRKKNARKVKKVVAKAKRKS